MQSAEAVVEILRARGRRGLPCERLYRQLFNIELFLLFGLGAHPLAFGYESLVLGGSPDAIGVPSRLVVGDWSRGCCAAAVPVTFRESGSCQRAC